MGITPDRQLPVYLGIYRDRTGGTSGVMRRISHSSGLIAAKTAAPGQFAVGWAKARHCAVQPLRAPLRLCPRCPTPPGDPVGKAPRGQPAISPPPPGAPVPPPRPDPVPRRLSP